ncbi:hypothetical protein PCNPT3_03265 [Psychromonas sp. CNPT3]|uniref:VC2046/SO_2500 family protein n=1 Tax=Psychromonas sp. CNPT3 TaxID=314282 RepID=UPI00006EA02A|nr:VC2046/SO_2500 family protein [Psychromonas sp. CNPT3]AGH80595.1 hypothetical protein PCNPT3_03265 [Psychromonas sp. CNPT3]
MNVEQNAPALLINEWQLGSQLNIALTSGARHKFNLLLSLLSSDVRDFSQFSLADNKEDPLKKLALRDAFCLSEPQPLVNEGITLTQAKALNSDVQAQRFSSIRLRYLLNNEALLSRQPSADISSDVVDNLSLLAQRRLAGKMPLAGALSADVSGGVDHQLMQNLQAMQLSGRPIKIHAHY